MSVHPCQLAIARGDHIDNLEENVKARVARSAAKAQWHYHPVTSINVFPWL